MIRRIFGWLGAAEHGDIFTMTLTQRVRRGESLPAARARMVPKETAYLDQLKEDGMLAGMSCTHPIWSEAGGGWHYHVHLLVEMPKNEWSVDRLKALYHEVAGVEAVQTDGRCATMVVAAGPADAGLLDDAGEPDFWTEKSTGLAKAVQYPVRDICQGISAKRVGVNREQVRECVSVLLNDAKGWKLRRTFGKWRKPPPPVETPKPEPVEEEKGKPSPGPAVRPLVYGTVHRVARLAAKGDAMLQAVVRELEASCRNDTDFGKRFVQFCRAASCGPPS